MTYLYIKQHNKTGLLYFGKTSKNPEKYRGSGKHWRNHLKCHGYDVTTLWWCLYTEIEVCSEFAIAFSKINNIVESESWANMMIEDGINGRGSPGRKVSSETRNKISQANKGRKHSDEVNKSKGLPGEKNPMYGVHRHGENSPHFGHSHSEESKLKISTKAKNRLKSICPHCSKLVDVANGKRWHFANCKLLPTSEQP